MMSQIVKKWAFSLSVLSVPLGFSLSADALPREPDYFCYELGRTSRVVNLNEMCAQSPPTGATGSSQADSKGIQIRPEVKKIFEFSELSFEGTRLIGSVKNKTRAAQSDAYLNFKVYKRMEGSDLKLIGAGRAKVLDTDLQPGKSSPFQGSVDAGADQIVITSVN